MIAAIGATGAVLAGGAVGFVFLIGAVSFNAYPTAGPEGEAPAAELSVVPLTSGAVAGAAGSAPGAAGPGATAASAGSTPFGSGSFATGDALPDSEVVAGDPGIGGVGLPGGGDTDDDDGGDVVAGQPGQPNAPGSDGPTTGAGDDEPLPQDPGGSDDPIVEPSPDPGAPPPDDLAPRPIEPNEPNAPETPETPATPETPDTGPETPDTLRDA